MYMISRVHVILLIILLIILYGLYYYFGSNRICLPVTGMCYIPFK